MGHRGKAGPPFTFVFSQPENGTQTGTAYYVTVPRARQPEPAGDVLIAGTPVGFDATAKPVQAGPVRLFTGMRSTAAVWSGDFPAAASVIAEAHAVCEATGTRIAPFAAMLLDSYRGNQAEVTPLIEAIIAGATAGGQGIAVTYALGGRDLGQRPRPPRRSAGGGPAGHRGHS